MSTKTTTLCPVCGKAMHERPVWNSLSRVAKDTYICNTCGSREALLSLVSRERTVCLYYDQVGGIMLVSENQSGYQPYGENPPDETAARTYVDAWNAALGHSTDRVFDIVASSMFGGQ